jgi:hypothetical protein
VKSGDPLKRKTPLNPGKGLARTSPLRSAGNGREGKAKAAPKKSARDTGPTKAMRDAVLRRDDFTCQMCGRDITGPHSLQHRLPRGRGGTNTMCNLVTVCGSATTPDMCHDDIENQARKRATREGFLVPSSPLITPENWPVLRFRDHWSMPGETGWTECEPHPDQLTWGLAA